jgi:hypothetical protein
MCLAAWSVVGESVSGGAGLSGLTVGELLASVGLLVGAPAVAWSLFGTLRIEVWPAEVRASFGGLGLFRKTVPLDRIQRIEAVQYSPLAEFGGWGMRVRPGKRAWTVRGNQAVRITLGEDPAIYLGTRHPQRLRERIESVMAHRTEPPTSREPERPE